MLPRLEGPALLKVSSCEQYSLEVQAPLREVGPNPGKPCCSLGLTYLISLGVLINQLRKIWC